MSHLGKIDSSRKASKKRGLPVLHENGGGGDGSSQRSQRMTRSLMSYGKPVTLDMPQLADNADIPARMGKNTKGKTNNNTTPSTKSTKHQTFDWEKVNKASPLGAKLSGRLSFEIDKKLQSINRSVTEFEKTNQNFKGRVKSAVRRSEQDALFNRKVMSQRNLMGMGDTGIPPVDESVYSVFMDEVEAELNKEELELLRTDKVSPIPRIPSASSCAMLFKASHGGTQEESRESISDSDSSSVMKKTMTKFPSEISSGEKKRTTRPSYVSLDDEIDKLETETLGPIMPKLSDKAFLTNLKKSGGKINENIQEMRNQIEAIKHKVEIDKRKADFKSQKLLYNPKRTLNSERIQGRSGLTVAGTKLTDFVQVHGGNTGSWSPTEHKVFLDIFRQHRHQPDKLIAMCQKRISGKSATEVMSHMKWYEQYISLSRSNQDQLRKWDMNKRRDRQMIYQMASEGQRTKLEDEKRRQEHLKNKRGEEKLRSKDLLSQWKMRKLQGSGVLESKTDAPINFDELQKEMLDLAEKVQTISNPNSKKLKPPGKFPASSSKRPAQVNAKPNPSQSGAREGVNRNVTVNLPNLQDNRGLETGSNNGNGEGLVFESRGETPNKFESLEDETIQSQGESFTGNVTSSGSRSAKTNLPFPVSHLTRETMSHKIRAHSQKLKKMELSSQHTKEPDRYEECQLWGAPSSILSGSKRAVPTWRKM